MMDSAKIPQLAFEEGRPKRQRPTHQGTFVYCCFRLEIDSLFRVNLSAVKYHPIGRTTRQGGGFPTNLCNLNKAVQILNNFEQICKKYPHGVYFSHKNLDVAIQSS